MSRAKRVAIVTADKSAAGSPLIVHNIGRGASSAFSPFSGISMIRRLSDGRYRLYSRKKDPKTGRRRNLGTFATRAAALKHERAVQFFKRRG